MKADSTLLALISGGGVYRLTRPVNSTAKDIVVGSLPVSASQLQRGVLNVNAYAPNLMLTRNGVQDNTAPDSVALENISQRIIYLFDDKAFADYYYRVQQQTVFSEPESNSHYSNIRIEYLLENL